MISTSSLVLDGHHGHGLGPGPGAGPGGPHHMAFVEPYLRGKLPVNVPEFLRPLPKPAPIVPRYNGRPAAAQSPRKDYPPSSTAGPVNLTAGKHDDPEIQVSRTSSSLQMSHLSAAAYTSRMFSHPGFYPPYGGLYASPYSPLLNRPTYINSTPLSPLERQYSPPETASQPQPPTPSNPAFLSPSAGFGGTVSAPQQAPLPLPPHSKPVQSTLREKRPFKVPVNAKDPGAVSKQRNLPSKSAPVKRAVNNNNNLLPPNFTKGSLIQLGNGELRRVEDVTTEDLVLSAERCPAFRLDPSTVVRIEDNSSGTVCITLSYGEHKKTVEIESTLEHPYFVYGQGWASCSPDRTMNCYGLQCHRLQVGDICISLSPRHTTAPLHTGHRSTHAQTNNRTEVHRAPSQERTGPNIDHGKADVCKPSDVQTKLEEASQQLKEYSEAAHSSDEERNSKRRRFSAPDRFDAEDEYIDPGSPSPVQKRLKD